MLATAQRLPTKVMLTALSNLIVSLSSLDAARQTDDEIARRSIRIVEQVRQRCDRLCSAIAITDAAARQVVRAHLDAYPIA